MNRDDFLLRRRAGLGGSDVAVILGLSPFRTEVDLWMDKTGRDTPDDLAARNRAVRFGNFGEQFVADEYTLTTGRRVHRYNTMLRLEGTPLLGNVDRLVVPEGAKIAAHRGQIRTDRGLECKTANTFAAFDSDEWGRSGTDQVPPAYLIQCMTYITVSKIPTWDLAVLFGNGARDDDFRVFTIRRDFDLEREIIARASEWWQRHVVADVAPAPVNESDVKRLFPRSQPRPIEADRETVEAVEKLRTVRQQLKTLETEKSVLEVQTRCRTTAEMCWPRGSRRASRWRSTSRRWPSKRCPKPTFVRHCRNSPPSHRARAGSY